jgi:hypothetical protein
MAELLDYAAIMKLLGDIAPNIKAGHDPSPTCCP